MPFFGLLNLPWWGFVIATLVMTQVTILAVTIFLHRSQAHRALTLHPVISHFFRLWLWMSTGMVTKEWVAIHRKHHAKVETAEDPHSPQVSGVWTVLFQGTELYKKGCTEDTLSRYGEGTPDDWMERHVYAYHTRLGITLMFLLDLLLFGVPGIIIWAIQMAWIPFFAAGVINGVAHYVGYRNFECPDASRNLLPLGLLVGGEELHNNHHTFATSARFSVKWWEVDMGWVVIRLLQGLGLARPKRVPPKTAVQPGKLSADMETLRAILANRFQVLAHYSRRVILPVLHRESRRAGEAGRFLYRRAKTLLVRDASLVDPAGRQYLQHLLDACQPLQVVYQFRERLQAIWAKSTATQTELLAALQEWCCQAEATGEAALFEFSAQLKRYVPAPAP